MKTQRYDVHLDIDHAKLSYSGTVELHVEHDGGPFLLNSSGLEIEYVSSGGTRLHHELVPAKEELRVDGLAPGPVRVEVAFRGKVAENALTGIYRTEYGGTHAIVTQLEPLGARRVIPCVDHPAQKAEFHVDVTVDPGLQVLFNTPVKERKELGSKVRFAFHPTPRMSTYLLFLGVGKFEERRRKSGTTEVIVATPPGRGDQADFALDHAGRILDFFGEYFGLPYPLPKLHLVAVPNTAVGGMENWGAIAFRERLILVGGDASPATRRTVLHVMAHEIAHQWFGDLVTMAWWNDVWLNESFATFMDFKACHHLYPDWQVWSDFALGTSEAQLWDAMPHSHPIDVRVEDPNEIHGIFDEISYQKGASILRMIEAYLGEEVFRAGVAQYLRKFSHGNARGADLWAALDEEAKQAVSKVLVAWLSRPGYPAVEASKEGEELALEQHPFSLVPPERSGDPATEGTPWPIPLNVLKDGHAAAHLMTGRNLRLPLKDPDSLVVNHGRRSFLRVRYEGELSRSILQRFPRLAPWDRWGVAQDTYGFLLSGQLQPNAYLDLLRSAREETDYLVLTELLQQTSILLAVLRHDPRYVAAVRELVEAQTARLGMAPRAGEPQWTGVLRQRFVGTRVLVDDAFASTLAPRFSNWEKEDPSLRLAIAVAYARTQGEKVFDEVLSRLKVSRTDEEKTRLSHALGMFRDPKAQERALGLPFGGEVSPTTGLEIFISMVMNPDAHTVMWGGMKEFFPVILQNFGGTGIVPLMLQWSVPYLGLGREEEVRSYFGSLDVGEGKSGLLKGLDLLSVYVRLRESFARGSQH